MKLVSLRACFLAFLFSLLTAACNSSSTEKKSTAHTDDWNTGSATITADTNLGYILDQFIPIYENFFPAAAVKFNYTSEDDAVKKFLNNKVTCIAIGRLLTDNEKAAASASQDCEILESTFAYDAIAVIANRKYKDSVFVLEKTSSYLDPSSSTKLVFDNARSGIAKLVMSLTGVKPGQFRNALDVRSTAEIFTYIDTHENAIGFIPFNLISDRDDSLTKHIFSTYNVLDVSFRDTVTQISQQSIAYLQYPLLRPISIYIGNSPELVCRGFTTFLFRQQIAKALLLSGLVPVNIPVRKVNVTDEFHPNR